MAPDAFSSIISAERQQHGQRTANNEEENKPMMYNTYMLEKWSIEVQKDRISEAKRYNKWVSARKAIRELSKNLSNR
jgi:hypothetical protein